MSKYTDCIPLTQTSQVVFIAYYFLGRSLTVKIYFMFMKFIIMFKFIFKLLMKDNSNMKVIKNLPFCLDFVLREINRKQK